MSGRVLVVDEDGTMCRMLPQALAKIGVDSAPRNSADPALELIRVEEFDVVIADVRMQGTSGLERCRVVADSRPDIPVIVVTAFGSMQTAIEAIRRVPTTS